MKKKPADLVPAQILRKDLKKVKKWAAQRDMKIYEIISILINKS